MWLLTKIDDRLHSLRWRWGLESPRGRALSLVLNPLCDLRLWLEYRDRDRKLARWRLQHQSDGLTRTTPGADSPSRDWEAAE